MKKNVVSNSVIELLSNNNNRRKSHKVKLKADLNKIKNQVNHLSLVDKVEKFSDNIPSEKMQTFSNEYMKKCERIGISNKSIMLKNGKFYHKSKSDYKKMSSRANKNCFAISKLAEQLIIDQYYFNERDSKYKKMNKMINQKKEKEKEKENKQIKL